MCCTLSNNGTPVGAAGIMDIVEVFAVADRILCYTTRMRKLDLTVERSRAASDALRSTFHQDGPITVNTTSYWPTMEEQETHQDYWALLEAVD